MSTILHKIRHTEIRLSIAFFQKYLNVLCMLDYSLL